jgi:hypothetical protein
LFSRADKKLVEKNLAGCRRCFKNLGGSGHFVLSSGKLSDGHGVLSSVPVSNEF